MTNTTEQVLNKLKEYNITFSSPHPNQDDEEIVRNILSELLTPSTESVESVIEEFREKISKDLSIKETEDAWDWLRAKLSHSNLNVKEATEAERATLKKIIHSAKDSAEVDRIAAERLRELRNPSNKE